MRQLNIKEAIKVYYNTTELSNKDIKSIFGNMSSATIAKMKRKVREEMTKKEVTVWNPHNINTEIAFEVWGLDIKNLEHRYKRLKSLAIEE